MRVLPSLIFVTGSAVSCNAPTVLSPNTIAIQGVHATSRDNLPPPPAKPKSSPLTTTLAPTSALSVPLAATSTTTQPDRPPPLPLPLVTPKAPLLAVADAEGEPVFPNDQPQEKVVRIWSYVQASLPAISEQGDRLWLDVSHFPCCANNGTVVVEQRQISVSPVVPPQQKLTTLFQYDSDGNATMSVTESTRRVNQLLAQMQPHRPRSLAPLASGTPELLTLDVRWGRYGIFLSESAPDKLELRVADSVVKTVKLPMLRQPIGFCCGADQPSKGCEVQSRIQHVWLDEPTNLVIVEVNYSSGPDGCELKSQHLIVRWPIPG